jgi:sigma-E factor negative regulatory protein RseC
VIEETGTVVDTDGPYAWVETERRSACGACQSAGECGTGALATLFGRRTVRLQTLNRIGARPGERVVVAVEEGVLTRGAIAAYALPLAGLLIGGGVGELLTTRLGLAQADLAAAALGGAGLMAGLFLGRQMAAHLTHQEGSRPVLTRRLSL